MLQQTNRSEMRSVVVHSKPRSKTCQPILRKRKNQEVHPKLFLKTTKTLIVVLSVFFCLSSVALGAPLPDFIIAPIDFRFSKNNPLEGESVIVTAYVKNIGGDARPDIEVRFYEGTPDEMGLQIEKGDIIIGLKSGRGKTVKVKWRAKAGSKDIYVVIDPDNAIEESNETNNQTHKAISSRALELKKPTQVEIETAIEKGLKWLRTQQGELVVYCPDGHENPSFMERCMICLKPLKGCPIKRKDNEKTRGGWNPIIGPGATALALMAFLHADVPESDQAVADGIDYLLHNTPEPDWNQWTEPYDFAAAILALTATGNKEKYLTRVRYFSLLPVAVSAKIAAAKS